MTMIQSKDGKVYNRTDTYENWIAYNPVLGNGELAIETDTVGTSMKIGDGITAYADLIYFAGIKSVPPPTCPYEVGDIYCTLSTVKPSERWQGTTWEELPAGRALVAQGTYTENGETFDFSAGSTGGEAKHQLTIGELASHTHKPIQPSGYTNHRFMTIADTSTASTARRQLATSSSSGIYTMTYNINSDDYVGTYDMYDSDNTQSTGSNTRHNNISPYISIYMYRRLS